MHVVTKFQEYESTYAILKHKLYYNCHNQMHFIDIQNQMIAIKSHMLDKMKKNLMTGFGINWNSPIYPYQLIILAYVLKDIYIEAGKVFKLGISCIGNKFEFLKYNISMKNVYYSIFNGTWVHNKLITYNSEGQFLKMACLVQFGLDIENYNSFLYFNGSVNHNEIVNDLDEIYELCKSGNAIGIIYLMNKYYTDMIL